METNDLELGDVTLIQKSAQHLLFRLKEHEDSYPNRFSPWIRMAPGTLRDLSPSSFDPREISIGPLHKDYIESDMLKTINLINLMNRISLPREEILNSCMQKVYGSMEQIKACYGYAQIMTADHANIEFAEMMVTDACFILEFINKISEYGESHRGYMLPDQTIIYDLVLLENQIPFFFLDEIFKCTVLKFKPNTKSLIEFIRPLLNLLNLFKADIKIDNISSSTTHHILSLLHECYKPRYPIRSTLATSTIHSAVDLDRAGVNFKPLRNPRWLLGMDVKYTFPCFSWCWGKPTLRMPVMYVHDFTELVLRNLIAYEQQSSQTCKYITSYAYAMDMLVSTQEDVAKLVDSRVLVNNMGSNKEAADMINRICREVACENSFYEDQWKTLNKYCNSYWPKNIARMRSTYFNSPWNIIALLAGIILFALTVVQTIFTIKSTGSD